MIKLFEDTNSKIIINALIEKNKALENINGVLNKKVKDDNESRINMEKQFEALSEFINDYDNYLNYKKIKDEVDKKVKQFLREDYYDFDFYEYKEILEKYDISNSDLNRLDELFKGIKLNNDEFVLDVIETLQNEISDLKDEIADLEEEDDY